MEKLTESMISLTRLSKDIKSAATILSDQEVRFLVDAYYIIQNDRIRSANQVRAMGQSEEPHLLLDWLLTQFELLENEIKKSLEVYSLNHPIGQWLRSICGIGPVIASGFLSHIDIKKAQTVGAIWRYAGLDPTCEWNKGEKRPFNATLKTLCWKLGESFVKVSSNDKDFYGKIYLQRKQEEIARNEAGLYAEAARLKLEKFKIGKDTDAYKAYSVGKLPPAHLHARAKRYAVKLFLSHLHEFWFVHEFGVMPPLPYPLRLEGHQHKIEIPV